MKELKVVSPVGEFSRKTDSAYSHVVVWESPRARGVCEAPDSRKSGVYGRWIKDRGYGVTWHGSERAARKAASGKYCWDWSAKLVGVFAVAA